MHWLSEAGKKTAAFGVSPEERCAGYQRAGSDLVFPCKPFQAYEFSEDILVRRIVRFGLAALNKAYIIYKYYMNSCFSKNEKIDFYVIIELKSFTFASQNSW